MSSIGTGNVGGALGRPLYQRKVIASPASIPESAPPKAAAPQSAPSPTPAALATISQAAPPNRTQALTRQLDDKLTSSLSQIRQKIGSGSSRSGASLDVKA